MRGFSERDPVARHAASVQNYLDHVGSIPGWFTLVDILLFRKINELQHAEGKTGDLLEIGVYRGKSAILLGYLLQGEERLVLCDLFGAPAPTADNESENIRLYPNLNRELFEHDYRRFHMRLPEILECPSDTLLGERKVARTFRFVHIDGGHTYDAVEADIKTTHAILHEWGVVAFDDHINLHAPGVVAAVWKEIASGRLVPFCMTERKMYAQLSPPRKEHLASLKEWAHAHPLLEFSTRSLFGHEIAIITERHSAPQPRTLRRLYWGAHAALFGSRRR
jgi:hypothetical protein